MGLSDEECKMVQRFTPGIDDEGHAMPGFFISKYRKTASFR